MSRDSETFWGSSWALGFFFKAPAGFLICHQGCEWLIERHHCLRNSNGKLQASWQVSQWKGSWGQEGVKPYHQGPELEWSMAQPIRCTRLCHSISSTGRRKLYLLEQFSGRKLQQVRKSSLTNHLKFKMIRTLKGIHTRRGNRWFPNCLLRRRSSVNHMGFHFAG